MHHRLPSSPLSRVEGGQLAPAKDGSTFVLVRQVDSVWVKVGQMRRVDAQVLGQ
jgi:hypothetical protein